MTAIVFNRLFPPATPGSLAHYMQTGLLFTLSLVGAACTRFFPDPGFILTSWALTVTLVFITQWLLKKISKRQ
jgi:hypothetical protein